MGQIKTVMSLMPLRLSLAQFIALRTMIMTLKQISKPYFLVLKMIILVKNGYVC